MVIKARIWMVFTVIGAFPFLGASAHPTATIRIESRIKAQEAIERVYYAHQIGATKPFEETITPAAIEAKVTKYSSIPLSTEVLEQEWERIRHGSRFPNRLSEIVRALGNDHALVLETFVRSSLADRLTRGAGTVPTEALAASLAPDTSCSALDAWSSGVFGSWPGPRSGQVGDWTGNLMIVWGGDNVSPHTGWRYDPTTDSWSKMAAIDTASIGSNLAHVWTGTEWLLWDMASLTGRRYNPSNDTWSPMSTTNAPASSAGRVFVWDGHGMILWGGSNFGTTFFNTGARYSPATDIWTTMTTVNAPAGRNGATAVWTGTAMIVWGGLHQSAQGPQPFNSGGRYDPATDTWSATSLVGVPTARSQHVAVWTGSKMAVWGGGGLGTNYRDGALYDPVSDTWSPMSTISGPQVSGGAAVWTGSKMIVWGGQNPTGGLYDPQSDSWTPTATTGAPSSSSTQIFVWTGSRVIVWGGSEGRGGRYDPATDSWAPTAVVGPPPIPNRMSVWTGTRFFLWGGGQFPIYSNDGVVYDPLLDSILTVSTAGAPSPRAGATATWTGDRVIVWGGANSTTVMNDGGRYDPVIDSWSAVTTVGAPAARSGHTAVWTGMEIVVWGGVANNITGMNSGGRYDPAADSWTPMSASGAPSGRAYHSAIWTGATMIVWGGRTGASIFFDSGGIYTPATDAWAATSRSGAPNPKYWHAAVWTGNRMLIAGGTEPANGGKIPPGTSASYDPVNDTWVAINLPAQSASGSPNWGFWTGTELLLWPEALRYNPDWDAWRALPSAGVPNENSIPPVWTGAELIVWGPNSYFADSGILPAADFDGDLVADTCDNCSATPNSDQMDTDGDGLGDACDICPLDAANDADHDGVCANLDNCNGLFNPHQGDSDGDGVGDLCDNCPTVGNAAETDTDGDGAGDACDCQPIDASVRAPGDIVPVMAGKSGMSAVFQWPAAPYTATYAVSRGELSALSLGAYGACLTSAVAGTTISDASVPAPGHGYFYLVQGRSDACGLGSLGVGAMERVRVNTDPLACN